MGNQEIPFTETDIALLKTSEILQDIPSAVVLEAIGAHLDRQFCLPPDKVFIEIGRVEPDLYIIGHGTIEMFVMDADGKEKILDFAKTGGTLAEETLFSDRSLQYSARSLTQVAVEFAGIGMDYPLPIVLTAFDVTGGCSH